MVTCCGALYPFGIANASLSRGMSVDGHSDRTKVLVRPQMTWSTEHNRVRDKKMNSKLWSSIDYDSMVARLAWNSHKSY